MGKVNVVKLEPLHSIAPNRCADRRFQPSTSPHPGGSPINAVGGGSPDSRRVCAYNANFPTRGTFPLSTSEQWPVAAFVPVTVAGAVPASHRLPSRPNERLRLFQNGKSLSSRAFFAQRGGHRSTNRSKSGQFPPTGDLSWIEPSGQMRARLFTSLTIFLLSFRFRNARWTGSRCKSGAAPQL